MKKIWLLCLCLAGLSLAWCFHVPDEDWLPSKNSVETWDIQKDDKIDQALNDIMEWIDMVSSDWNELKNEENDKITEDVDVNAAEKNIDNEEMTDEEVENDEVENDMAVKNIPYEEQI